MLWDEPKIFFLERRYFFSIILSEFLKNRVALQARSEDGNIIPKGKMARIVRMEGVKLYVRESKEPSERRE